MDLLEREHELQKLAKALNDALAGRGSIALVSGEAGIGKTSYVERFVEMHGPTMRVLTGHCDPLFTPTPLGPLYDIARQVGGRLLAQLEGEAARASLFSTLLDQLQGGGPSTLLVIEDIHWADEATLDLLKFLGRRILSTRILVVLTYRDDEVGAQPSLRMLLGALAASKATHRIELQRLTVEAVHRLIGGRSVDPVALHRQTSGNPFFVTEVLSSDNANLPATVRDAVLARAARLEPAGRAVLEAAAVIGSRIEHAMLERVLDGAVAGLAECMQVGVIETTAGGVAFRHELARDAILMDIDPARRRDLNRLALGALKSTGGRRSDLALLVQYAEGAGDAEAVLEFGAAAARAAATVGAHRQAVAHYERVLRHAGGRPPAERAVLCEAYAEECSIVDDLAEAERARRQAIELWREVGDPLKEAGNHAELAWPLVRSGRNAEADETSHRAIEMLEPLPPSRQLATAYRVQAHLRMLDRDSALAIRLGRKAIELATRFEDDVTIAAAENVIGTAMLVTGDEKGRSHLERSIALAGAAGLDVLVGIGHTNLGAAYCEQYRFAAAERHLLEGIAFATERDVESANLHMHAWLGLTRLYQGRWTEARDIAACVVARPNAAAISRIMALVALGRLRTRRGDPGADSALDEALDLALRTDTLQRLAPVRAARAEGAWLVGDRARAVAEATATYDLAMRCRHRWHVGEFAYWRRLAGDPAEPPKWSAAPFLSQIKGDWRRAAAAWQRRDCPYEQARALADGDTEAQIAALEIFNRLDAAPAAASLRQRMRSNGVRRIPRGPRATTRSNPFGLTTRELEILGCMARGLTNGGIGARLHVSPKTVDHHVSSVLSKLGAASRGEAARIAHAEHLLVKNGEDASLN